MGSRCVQFGVISLTLSYWSLEVQHGKELSEDLKKELLLYIKMKKKIVIILRASAQWSSSKVLVNVKVYEIANQSVEGGIHCSQALSYARLECELR